MTTLVVCVDRTDDVGRRSGVEPPIAGRDAVSSLVIDVGLADPEDASVNSLLETLRIADDLGGDGERAVPAVVSGHSESMVSADRAVAQQLDELVAEYDPDSAVVVIDSAEDERLVPIVESRVAVDSVDRVVVRQARDLESTYYLLKQFLADEELRQTTLVPLGTALLVFPALALLATPAVAAATITTVIGLFLLYKGLAVDELIARLVPQAKEALYSGQVSVVTYVVAAGLTLIGIFVGALEVSSSDAGDGVILTAMQFAYYGVPWLAMAAVTAATGRLLDELLRESGIRTSYLNLPFVVLAIGLVVRGFSAFLLEQEPDSAVDPITVPALELGVVSVASFQLEAGQRLALFVVAGVLVSLAGVRVASYVSASDWIASEGDVEAEREPGSSGR